MSDCIFGTFAQYANKNKFNKTHPECPEGYAWVTNDVPPITEQYFDRLCVIGSTAYDCDGVELKGFVPVFAFKEPTDNPEYYLPFFGKK
jgi:hypothetical protein